MVHWIVQIMSIGVRLKLLQSFTKSLLKKYRTLKNYTWYKYEIEYSEYIWGNLNGDSTLCLKTLTKWGKTISQTLKIYLQMCTYTCKYEHVQIQVRLHVFSKCKYNRIHLIKLSKQTLLLLRSNHYDLYRRLSSLSINITSLLASY